jgi:hypothetical protein
MKLLRSLCASILIVLGPLLSAATEQPSPAPTPLFVSSMPRPTVITSPSEKREQNERQHKETQTEQGAALIKGPPHKKGGTESAQQTEETEGRIKRVLGWLFSWWPFNSGDTFNFLLVLVGAGQVYLLYLAFSQDRPFLSVEKLELLNFVPLSEVQAIAPLAVKFFLKNYGKEVAVGINGRGKIALRVPPDQMTGANFEPADKVSIESEVLDAGEESSPCYLLYRGTFLKDEEFVAVRDRQTELVLYGTIDYSDIRRDASIWRRNLRWKRLPYSTSFERIFKPASGFQVKSFFDVGSKHLDYKR